jgi:hypothetical protein
MFLSTTSKHTKKLKGLLLLLLLLLLLCLSETFQLSMFATTHRLALQPDVFLLKRLQTYLYF